MKIKALTRSAASAQAPGSDVARQPRNLDPALHPFARAREYTRALNATKLERMFAKPFIAQLGRGHVDGVYTMAKDPNSLQRFASGSGDGIVKVWDLTSREEIWNGTAHENIVKGMAWTRDQKLLTCASDRTIKLFDPYNTPSRSVPSATWLGTNAFTSISHHRSHNSFAVASGVISIYDLERYTAPPEELKWPTSTDTITAVSFNQTETSILASVATDRSIVLYDLRTSSPVAKTVLKFASNAISWNPMEAFNFAVANEDHNIYIFDMRKLDRALNILKDHVAAVMDVEFSPTGEELVSASYDRTVRLWSRMKGHSRDIYHTKRMQRVFSVKWTPDSKYILSGSDDGNIRLWRANASKREGIKSAKQRQSLEYSEALVERYSHMPEIRRIKRHRHIPKVVKKAGFKEMNDEKATKPRESTGAVSQDNISMTEDGEQEIDVDVERVIENELPATPTHGLPSDASENSQDIALNLALTKYIVGLSQRQQNRWIYAVKIGISAYQKEIHRAYPLQSLYDDSLQRPSKDRVEKYLVVGVSPHKAISYKANPTQDTLSTDPDVVPIAVPMKRDLDSRLFLYALVQEGDDIQPKAFLVTIDTVFLFSEYSSASPVFHQISCRSRLRAWSEYIKAQVDGFNNRLAAQIQKHGRPNFEVQELPVSAHGAITPKRIISTQEQRLDDFFDIGISHVDISVKDLAVANRFFKDFASELDKFVVTPDVCNFQICFPLVNVLIEAYGISLLVIQLMYLREEMVERHIRVRLDLREKFFRMAILQFKRYEDESFPVDEMVEDMDTMALDMVISRSPPAVETPAQDLPDRAKVASASDLRSKLELEFEQMLKAAVSPVLYEDVYRKYLRLREL
ncbi:hypothetical protein B7494_g1561 [Chlorociboria aeruginascens]|nr:hypothetical protein B7494_g1561 [Chlorociboria aeruginascens]